MYRAYSDGMTAQQLRAWVHQFKEFTTTVAIWNWYGDNFMRMQMTEDWRYTDERLAIRGEGVVNFVKVLR